MFLWPAAIAIDEAVCPSWKKQEPKKYRQYHKSVVKNIRINRISEVRITIYKR